MEFFMTYVVGRHKVTAAKISRRLTKVEKRSTLRRVLSKDVITLFMLCQQPWGPRTGLGVDAKFFQAEQGSEESR
jgi:hypothetical protein